jgi:hypothetical protein
MDQQPAKRPTITIYYIFGYVGSCQYCFEFSTNDNHNGIIPRDDTLGHLVIRLEAIPWDGDLPVDSINNWTMIQCEWRRGEGDVNGLNTSRKVKPNEARRGPRPATPWPPTPPEGHASREGRLPAAPTTLIPRGSPK